MEKDFNILRSAKPGTWQDGFHYLREEQEHLREKKLLLLRKPEMQQLSMWSWYWFNGVNLSLTKVCN